MLIGKSMPRVDAHDKAAGRTMYTDDLCPRKALIAKIVHSTVAHGIVKSVDISEAKKVPGVIKIVTCFDVPDYPFPTAGHPYSLDPAHQDVADRHLLVSHVRYYGDDVAAVVAEDEVSAVEAVRLIKVEYETLPFVLDAQEAMKDGAPQLHEKFPNNILAHTSIHNGNYEEASKEKGLIKVEGWYDTPTVQHCHIENAVCFAYEENEKIVVVASTQIPHIVRRVVGTALGVDWGRVRIVKPYIGGGFGDKQDALYEPLCAYLSTQVGGRLVKLETTREETFVNCRVRHALRTHFISFVRKDGTLVARKVEVFSNQGAYASHGHAIAAKGLGAVPQLYPCPNVDGDAYTIFTNRSVAGAMRGYGMPQATWAIECHTDDICRRLNLDPLQYRMEHTMPMGFKNDFFKNELYSDTFRQTLTVGAKYVDYEKKYREYQNQEGDVRRGVGCSVFWYTTGVWPISLESVSCRMVLNQDGSVQVQLGETEIGQGADTAFTQMAADTLGVPFHMVHVVSCQDTDVTPFGTGAYASRQTYEAGLGIRGCGEAFKEKILQSAYEYTRMQPYLMDIIDGNIVRVTDGRILMSLGDLAKEALYNKEHSEHLSMEKTTTSRSNAYSFGCCFAEIEVDIPMCKVKVLKIINVHDAGTIINPALAKAQVEGGMSMGIGYALSEQLLYDQKTGKALNNNLLDYKLSTFMDHPHLEVQFVENPEPTSAYGTKALGEPPTLPVAPAIRNALLNATGVEFDELPMNPHNLFRKFSEAHLIKD
ncbi:MAG: xanthine dehydrogenase molybdenum-binding subunit XdhA [Lachnospiraceae bacterium]|jgi:xanthine dehydrogenase molybdenum-binding subunit|nr:xanthine dehydrogenase molybdenum-binding subunit XdhA [Lachnospiraceae bacterium]